jgi:hypothetical protein
MIQLAQSVLAFRLGFEGTFMSAELNLPDLDRRRRRSRLRNTRWPEAELLTIGARARR